jgi:flagellar hook-associated protein 1
VGSLNANLEIARRALRAQQLTMGVIGSNISNVNTPGYSRRRVQLAASAGIMTAEGTIGSGVQARGIRRDRDVLLDGLYREHNSSAGGWDALQQTLSKVETVFPANDSGGLGEALGAFWTAWNDLANDPADPGRRAVVRSAGAQVTDTLNRLDGHIASLMSDLNSEISADADRINRISSRLATLNVGIADAELGGGEASDLRDERDSLLEELSGIATVHTQETSTGAVTVTLGTEVLVQDNRSRQLVVVPAAGMGDTAAQVRWQDTQRAVTVEGGHLAGLQSARDDRLAGYRTALDNLAATLVSQVNQVHGAGRALDGSSGHAFFDPTKTHASDIRLDQGVETDLGRIAASASGATGDGNTAMAIAGLRTATVLGDGQSTFEGFYRNLVGQIGLDASHAESSQKAENGALDAIDAQRASVSGVSLDEEMTQMLSTQHAYEAVIRITAVIDDMMDKLVTGL